MGISGLQKRGLNLQGGDAGNNSTDPKDRCKQLLWRVVVKIFSKVGMIFFTVILKILAVIDKERTRQTRLVPHMLWRGAGAPVQIVHIENKCVIEDVTLLQRVVRSPRTYFRHLICAF